MDGDRPRPANRNCYRLSHVSRALAQISCLLCSCYNVTVCLLVVVFLTMYGDDHLDLTDTRGFSSVIVFYCTHHLTSLFVLSLCTLWK